MALSRKHQAFCNEYLECFNATEAYMRVYHPKSRDVAAAAAARLLGNVKVAEEIDRRLSEDAMRPTEVLKRLAQHGRADLGDYIHDDGEIDIPAMRRAKATRLLHKFKRTTRSGVSQQGTAWDETRIEVELYDAQAALVQIGKAHKLFVDKSDVTLHGDLAVKGYTNVSPDDWDVAAPPLHDSDQDTTDRHL